MSKDSRALLMIALSTQVNHPHNNNLIKTDCKMKKYQESISRTYTSCGLLLLMATTAVAFAPLGAVPHRAAAAVDLNPRFQHIQTADTTMLFGEPQNKQNENYPFSKDLETRRAKPELEKWWDSSKVAMASTCMGLFLMFATAFHPAEANAAMTGGRIGGSYSSPAPAARSLPSRSSYGSPSSYRSSFSSRSYYSPTIIAPRPFITPVPVYAGPSAVVTGGFFPSIFDVFFWGAVGTVIFSTFQGITNPSMEETTSAGVSALGPGTSVVSLSLALRVPNRNDRNSILAILNRLSETAQTDSRVGLQNLTSQLALELLRQRDSWTAARSTHEHWDSIPSSSAQRRFNQVAVQERSKFGQETVAKYGGVDYGEKNDIFGDGSFSSSDQATMSVVTLVLHIRGNSLTKNKKSVSSLEDVRHLLTKIAADSKVDDCLQGAEILWTPGDARETLTQRDVVADYPELRSL